MGLDSPISDASDTECCVVYTSLKWNTAGWEIRVQEALEPLLPKLQPPYQRRVDT